MSTIDYHNGDLAIEKAEELLNGESAVNKIKIDSSVIDCDGSPDFESAFKTLYDKTIQDLENIVLGMKTELENMRTIDSELESNTKVPIDFEK